MNQRRRFFIATALAPRFLTMIGANGFVANSIAKTNESIISYPSRPIHLLAPFPPGGAVDFLARLIGEQLTMQMGQPVIVENKPGANGNLAGNILAESPGDGYTLMLSGNGLATNTALYPSANYDMLRDLRPVSYIGYAPLILTVPVNSKFKSLQDVIEQARKAPGTITFASAGYGSSSHLGVELLKYMVKIDLLHIPYKGGAPAIVDLIGGRVMLMMQDPPQAMPHIQSGMLKVLAVGGPTRFNALPNVPTMAEAGYPGLKPVVWWGVVAPSSTPTTIVEKLNAEINKALMLPNVRRKLEDLGVTPGTQTVKEFDTYLRSEIARWIIVAKSAGLKGD